MFEELPFWQRAQSLGAAIQNTPPPPPTPPPEPSPITPQTPGTPQSTDDENLLGGVDVLHESDLNLGTTDPVLKIPELRWIFYLLSRAVVFSQSA